MMCLVFFKTNLFKADCETSFYNLIILNTSFLMEHIATVHWFVHLLSEMYFISRNFDSLAKNLSDKLKSFAKPLPRSQMEILHSSDLKFQEKHL